MTRKVLTAGRKTARRWLTSRGTLLALMIAAGSGVGFRQSVLAVHDTGAFELDGNATSVLSDDWDRVCHQVSSSACPTASNTNNAVAVSWTFDGEPDSSVNATGGSKDTLDFNNWRYQSGSVVSFDNLQHSFAARYSLPATQPSGSCTNGTGDLNEDGILLPPEVPFDATLPCDVLYFGIDRFGNTASAVVGFWFLQNAISYGANGLFNGAHRAGDLLVLVEFSGALSPSVTGMAAYKWQPACTGADGTCAAANLETLLPSVQCADSVSYPQDILCGLVNSGNEAAPWPFVDSGSSTGFRPAEFFEGGINLSALRLSGQCFASVLAETRSTLVTDASLIDFVLGPFGSCSDTITVANGNDSGAGSLRQAISDVPAGGTINFDLPPQTTITLSSVLDISKNMTIAGPGAGLVTVSGNDATQIFHVLSGVTASISGLTMKDGNNANGGAVENEGALTISNSTFTSNSAAQGGAVNSHGTLLVTDSTFDGNSSSASGGALINFGTATVIGSTFTGNTGSTGGGGIMNIGPLTVTNSTFAGNQTTGGGGGVFTEAVLHLTNSTFSGNTAVNGKSLFTGNSGTSILKGTLLSRGASGTNCVNLNVTTSQGYNLSDDTSCAALVQTTDQNNTPAGLDPSGLQNNGGPTKTIALLGNSAAVQKIPAASCTDVDGDPVLTDQRGVSRPQASACDIGAYEVVWSAPTMTNFSPTSGAVGTVVTISGTALAGANAVTFNGLDTPFTVNSDTQLTATVTAGTTTGPIAVHTPGGIATSSSNFTVVANAPTITSFSPSSGPVGTSVTISGTNLKVATAVTFNGIAATFKVQGAQINATVPTGATSGPIVVTTPGGVATSAANFTVVTAPPTISSFTPSTGPSGTVVTIDGTNFGGVTNVMFDGKMAKFTFVNNTRITATVPGGLKAGSVPISVTTPIGTAVSSSNFAVTK